MRYYFKILCPEVKVSGLYFLLANVFDSILEIGRQVTEEMKQDINDKLYRIEDVQKKINQQTCLLNASNVAIVAGLFFAFISSSLPFFVGSAIALAVRINLELNLQKREALLQNLVKESLKDECVVEGGASIYGIFRRPVYISNITDIDKAFDFEKYFDLKS